MKVRYFQHEGRTWVEADKDPISDTEIEESLKPIKEKFWRDFIRDRIKSNIESGWSNDIIRMFAQSSIKDSLASQEKWECEAPIREAASKARIEKILAPMREAEALDKARREQEEKARQEQEAKRKALYDKGLYEGLEDNPVVDIDRTFTLKRVGGEIVKLKLICPQNTPITTGSVTTASPVGKQVIKKHIGDTIEVIVGPNKVKYTILDIERKVVLKPLKVRPRER